MNLFHHNLVETITVPEYILKIYTEYNTTIEKQI